jgi:hypothetical protein
MTNSPAGMRGIRWSALKVTGNKLFLVSSQGIWQLPLKEDLSEQAVQHLFQELHAWSKEEHELRDFKDLCQS